MRGLGLRPLDLVHPPLEARAALWNIRFMRVLLTGGTGFVGSAIREALLGAGHHVRAVSRRPPAPGPEPRLEWFELDFMAVHAPADWQAALDEVDVVINAVGIIREEGGRTFEQLHARAPIALFDACAAAGVERVVQISAAGVEGGALPYQTSKAAADAHLRALDLHSVILRPSLVFGAGGQSARLFRMLAGLPAIPLVGEGGFMTQPVDVAEVAEAALRAAEGRGAGCYFLGGAEPHSLRSMLAEYHGWLSGGTARFLPVPMPLMRLGARLGDLTGLGPINSAELRMLAEGATGDMAPFVADFGFEPRGLGVVLGETPAGEADRWHARMTALQVPLRLLVASIWIITPIVSLWGWERGLALLGDSGFPEPVRAPLLVCVCILEFGVAGAFLARWRTAWVGGFSIGLMLFYTVLLSITSPELWMDPFGPLSKNLPLIGATLALMILDSR